MHPASCSLIIRDLLLLVDGTLDTKNGFLTITHRRDDQVPVECDYKLEALLDPGALNSNIFYVLAINAWATEDAYDADQNLVQPYLPDSIPRWFFDKHALWESTQDQWRPYVQVDGG